MGCPEYELFYNRLTRGVNNMKKQLEHADDPGYLQQPLKSRVRGKHMFNLKCCCQSHCPHRESDKFLIANERGEDEKLENMNIFGPLEEGEPEII